MPQYKAQWDIFENRYVVAVVKYHWLQFDNLSERAERNVKAAHFLAKMWILALFSMFMLMLTPVDFATIVSIAAVIFWLVQELAEYTERPRRKPPKILGCGEIHIKHDPKDLFCSCNEEPYWCRYEGWCY